MRRSSGQGRYLGSPKPSCSTSMIDRQTSRPIRSASASGPMGWAAPSFIASSMASGVAAPSCTRKAASLIIGTSRRFTAKPGESPTGTAVLPSASVRASMRATVASLVCSARITSTSLSTGTGLKKCMPTTRSGRSQTPARRVSDSDEVLEARIASWVRRLRSRNSFSLSAGCSGAASMITSHSRSASRVVVVSRRAMADALSASLSFSLATSLPSPLSMAAVARPSCSSATS